MLHLIFAHKREMLTLSLNYFRSNNLFFKAVFGICSFRVIIDLLLEEKLCLEVTVLSSQLFLNFPV